MLNENFPVKMFLGRGCLKNNSDLFSDFGKKCLIVTGKSSAILSGALKDVTDIFEISCISYEIFDEVEPNPLTLTCKKAGDLAASINADFILGIGGGSVLDASKAIAIFASNPDLSHSKIYERAIPSAHLPVILIGTTSGTGSEVTGVSVLTNADTGLKKSISGKDCYAEVVFGDYTYTMSTPEDVRISTALDAFSHAVEAYLSSTANSDVLYFSSRALSYLKKYITSGSFSSLNDEDYESLYIASVYAGLAINLAGTCFPHTVGYYLTENYGIPHGRACAAFFPVFAARAKKYCPERFEAILKILDTDEKSLIENIIRLTDINIKIEKSEAQRISLRWKNGVKNFDRTPGGFTYKDAESALLSL